MATWLDPIYFRERNYTFHDVWMNIGCVLEHSSSLLLPLPQVQGGQASQGGRGLAGAPLPLRLRDEPLPLPAPYLPLRSPQGPATEVSRLARLSVPLPCWPQGYQVLPTLFWSFWSAGTRFVKVATIRFDSFIFDKTQFFRTLYLSLFKAGRW